MRKTNIAAAAAVGLAATLVAAPIAQAQQQNPGQGNGGQNPAYAEANGALGYGLLEVDLVRAISADGNTVEDNGLVKLGQPGPVLDIGVATAKASPGRAEAQLARVGLLGIEADVIKATCDENGGATTVANASVFGQEILDVSPGANTTISVLEGKVAEVTLNRQTENPDGSLTVDGLVVDLLDSSQELIVSQATCTPGPDNPNHPDNPGDGGGDGDNGGDDGDNGGGDGGNGDGNNPGDGNGGGNGDGDNGNGGGNDDANNGGDNGDNGNVQPIGPTKPNDDGTAPSPEPAPGHLDVTG